MDVPSLCTGLAATTLTRCCCYKNAFFANVFCDFDRWTNDLENRSLHGLAIGNICVSFGPLVQSLQ